MSIRTNNHGQQYHSVEGASGSKLEDIEKEKQNCTRNSAMTGSFGSEFGAWSGCQQRQHCQNTSKEVCGMIPRTSLKDKRNTAQDNLPTIMMESPPQAQNHDCCS
jgi:hypothetical protein